MKYTRSATLAATVVVLIALTGCAEHPAAQAATTSESMPSPVSSAAPTTGDDLDSITQELQGVDNSMSQADTDTAAGDTAASQGDQP